MEPKIAFSPSSRVRHDAVAEATDAVLADKEICQNVARLAKTYAKHEPVAETERLTLG